MGTTRHFHIVFDVRVLDLNPSNDVGTPQKFPQQKNAKTMKKKFFLMYFQPTDPNFLPSLDTEV
jgi:hypothetical protein